nr:MAG TPA: hypothetical protein [Caudoviricetes sp.]
MSVVSSLYGKVANFRKRETIRYIIYSKKNEPRLSVVGAFLSTITNENLESSIE